MGVTRQTVSNWELDQTVPDANQLLALSKALNTSIDLLVGNDIQNLLEQKVGNVETEIIKNNKFQKNNYIGFINYCCTIYSCFYLTCLKRRD